LLEVMLAHHSSGLAVIAAPNRPAEMRSFDPDVVTRLLDLVSSHFDYVVIDMPRTWFSWTDSVLLGSNKLFIVSEMTVPACATPSNWCGDPERLGDGVQPKVIVNRFEQRMFAPGLRRPISNRRWATTSPGRFRTITGWCARRSTAACRSTRSRRATVSASSRR
jgi:pilus assembly protein CpaE